MPCVTSTRSASRHHRRPENQGFAVSPAQPPPPLVIRLPALFPEGTIRAPIHRGDYARACAPSAHPGHLHARDTTLAFASRAPQGDIQRLKERHGWNHIPWYTIDKDFDVDEWHGTNAFIREGDRVFRTYFIDNRGDKQMGNTWNYHDVHDAAK
jgi:hypothetical protein